MDFKDELLILAERVGKLKDNVKTEEATKTSFVLPFLQALGYDIFNPEEVTPECICDYGTKKGEKIDYTVCMDGEPIMLIECKIQGATIPLLPCIAGQIWSTNEWNQLSVLYRSGHS